MILACRECITAKPDHQPYKIDQDDLNWRMLTRRHLAQRHAPPIDVDVRPTQPGYGTFGYPLGTVGGDDEPPTPLPPPT